MSNDNKIVFTRKFTNILEAEADYIQERRKQIEKMEYKELDKKLESFEKPDSCKDWKFNGGYIGLALSGGGIRSATFNLGLIQALARKNVLKFCDYISTVSGGGYIGSCLSSLLDNKKASTDFEKFPFRFQRDKESDERKEIKWLRKHSRYLAPNTNIFSLDIWRLVGLFLSGLILTNVTTVSLIIFITYCFYLIVNQQIFKDPILIATWLAYFSFTFFVLMIITRLGAALRNLSYKGRRWRGYLQGGFALTSAILIIVSLIILLAVNLPGLEKKTAGFLGKLLNGGTALSILGMIFGMLKSQSKRLQKLVGKIFSIAWILFLPLMSAQLIRWIWSTDAFDPSFYGVPNLIYVAVGLLIIGFLTNTNRISMHHFYRDRLSEAYIIKSSGDEVSTIISNESLTLGNLHGHKNGAPYHLINTTLNIPDSENIYIRGRGADFFVFSKLYCGSDSTGYRSTDDYEKGTTRLATAMAISGAAASPQMGTSTSPILTFILSLLNVRLNRWMPNPDPARKTMINFWPYYFVKELLQMGKEDDRLINLSDGGHHENLGVYELIRRRCQVIISSDAGADPDLNFGDLANLIRKVRIDMGVNINLDLSDLRVQQESIYSKKYFALGYIDYPDSDNGLLIYIKSSLTGNESEDLLAYDRKNDSFPHQTTADQFFDESQFESYRELGYVIGTEIFS